MENASKALIIAAEVLIGMIVISIGVYLFKYFSNYSEENYKIIETTQITEFNNKFLKFYGETTVNGVKKPIECTIHDIVSLANLAQRTNIENDLIEEHKQGNNQFQKKEDVDIDNSLYIQINLYNKTNKIDNLELKSNEYLITLIKENDLIEDELSGKKTKIKYYKCITCESKGNNSRINLVEFTINDK